MSFEEFKPKIRLLLEAWVMQRRQMRELYASRKADSYTKLRSAFSIRRILARSIVHSHGLEAIAQGSANLM